MSTPQSLARGHAQSQSSLSRQPFDGPSHGPSERAADGQPHSQPVSLTQLVHEHVAARIRCGGQAIDATAGNGHDTCFLARAVGPQGRVLALDIQPAAVAATRARLEAAGLLERVTLRQADHCTLPRLTHSLEISSVDAVLFNLGYHPGGDRSIITTPESTLPALEAALTVLRGGGMLSILAYRGHPGGEAEAEAVAEWCRTQEQARGEAQEQPPEEHRLTQDRGGQTQEQPPALRYTVYHTPNPHGPVLHLLERLT